MQLPGIGQRVDQHESARVREIVKAVIADDNVTIMVTELTCTEPGCPPRETVIALMHPGAPVQYKIHKPLREVNPDDIAAAFAASEHEHDHP